MMNPIQQIKHFKKTCRVINSHPDTEEGAKQMSQELQEINKDYRGKGVFQKILDFLATPYVLNDNESSGRSQAIMLEGHAKAQKIRDGKEPEVHKHLHIHKK